MPASRLLSLLIVLSCPLTGWGETKRAERPNVLFIAVDDLNDWIGALEGNPQVKTPNFDRLAQRGMLFTNANCAAPACNPSRTSLLTGVLPSTSGVYHNSQPWRPALPNAVTLPQFFSKQGYEVVGCGKIFHDPFHERVGWDQYLRRVKDVPSPLQVRRNPQSHAGEIQWGALDQPDAKTNDYQMVSFANEFLAQKHERPFFLAVGLFRPHLPWWVPRDYFDRFPLDQIELPDVPQNDLDDVPSAGKAIARQWQDHAAILKSHNWRRAVQGYLASIAYTDAQLGRLLEAFDKSPEAANTVVVLWSDHGWHLGEKEHWRKFTLWEEATRVPLIFIVPGLTAENRRTAAPVGLIDIAPTLADLCGFKSLPQWEGASLRPLLQDPQAAWNRPALTTHGRNNHALRGERYRYIRYADGGEELYDHERDPHEWRNLADDAQFAEVKSEFARWLPQKNAAEAPSVERRAERGAGRKNRE